MVIKISAKGPKARDIGNAFMQLLILLSNVAGVDDKGLPLCNPEDLHFEFDPDGDGEPRMGGAKVFYAARLPKLPDGHFDMAKVDQTVRQNLEALGAHTINGIVYDNIVQATLAGEQLTERALRDKLMLKSGSSQGAVQKLRAAQLIISVPKE